MTTFILRRSAPLLAALAVLAHTAHAQQDEGHCHYVQVAKAPVRYATENLLPAIDSSINGEPALMLIGTDMFTNVLTMAGATRHHLELVADQHRFVSTGAGRSRVYVAKMDSFTVAQSRTEHTEMDVIRDSTSTQPNDGVIGASYLFQADLEIALADKQIKFFRSVGSACDDKFLAYWDPSAVVVRAAPGRVNHQNPHFTVELNGQAFDAVINSATPYSFVERSAARRAGAHLDAAAATSARFDTLSIGTETINNAQLDAVDLKGGTGADVYLGADFLRTHRILFSRGQRKLYISYVGGVPFGPRKGIEPWVQQEADAGNRDAELALARAYWVAEPASPAKGSAWLYKAAAHGQPQAAFDVGTAMLKAGFYQEATVYLRRALDELPSERTPALWLYVARVRMRDTEYARRELAHQFPPQSEQDRNFLAAFFFGEERPWPAPVADFYLDRINAETLLAQAAKDKNPELRVREAKFFIDALSKAQSGPIVATAVAPGSARETVLQAPPPAAHPSH